MLLMLPFQVIMVEVLSLVPLDLEPTLESILDLRTGFSKGILAPTLDLGTGLMGVLSLSSRASKLCVSSSSMSSLSAGPMRPASSA
jgi:hypothetical protein